MAATNDQRGTATGTGFLIQCGLGADLSISVGAISVSDSAHRVIGSGTLSTISWAASNTPANPSVLYLIRPSGSTWTFGTGGNINAPGGTQPTIEDDTMITLLWDGVAWRIATTGNTSLVNANGGAVLTPSAGAITVTNSFHSINGGTLSTINGGIANSLYVLKAQATFAISAATNIITSKLSIPTGTLLSLWFDGTNYADLSDESSAHILRIESFGGVGDSVTDNTTAFTNALAALPAGGGVIEMGPGEFYIPSTFDLTTNVSVWLRGAGPYATRIISGATTSPGIIAASSATRLVHLSDFGLFQSGRALPVTPRADNYGIRNDTSGIAYGMLIENLDVRFFGNDGIYIQGSTGPSAIRDCSLQSNAGYGIQVATFSGQTPQDVSVTGGNIQISLGGIKAAAISFSIEDTDIELDSNGIYPAVYLNGCAGVSLRDVSASVASTVSPAAVVAVNNSVGVNCTAGVNYVNGGVAGIDNIGITGSGSHAIKFVNGNYSNSNPGGYYASVSSATGVGFEFPSLGTYQSNHNVVNDAGAGNNVIAIGVGTVIRGTSSAAGISTPSVAADSYIINGGTAIVGHLSATTSWSPGTVNSAASATKTITVTGAAVGDTVTVGLTTLTIAGLLISGSVTATNTVTATIYNASGSNQTISSGTLRADVWKH